MVKVAVRADVEEQVLTALAALLPRGVDPGHDDDLDDLLPDVGDLEALILAVEESFDVDFTDAETFDLFATGTVGDLIEAVTKHLMSKTAGYDRSYYVQNREKMKVKSRTYRARNLYSVRRKAKIYRRRVKRRAIRPRKRVGNTGSGFHFIAR